MSEVADLQSLAAKITADYNAEMESINAQIAALQAAPTPPAPTNETLTISGISPLTGAGGSAVTITGAGFGATKGGGTVAMGFLGMAVTSWSDTQIVAVVPMQVTAGQQYDFVVTLPSGVNKASSPPYFTVSGGSTSTPTPTPVPTPGPTPTPLPVPTPTPTPTPSPTPPSGTASLQILSPVQTIPNTNNQLGANSVFPPTVAVSDTDMIIPPNTVMPFKAKVTGGIVNVSVTTHNKKLFDLTPDANGIVSANIDISQEVNEPLVMEALAFDVPPGGAPTIQIPARVTLIIPNGRSYNRGIPAGATGFKQIFREDWSNPSIATSPTDFTKRWGTHQAKGLDYGTAVFEDFNGPDNVFKVITIPGGAVVLRIRSGLNLAEVDPQFANSGRAYYGGGINARLNTTPPSSQVPTLNTAVGGYVETRVMAPKGETPFPACLWLLPVNVPQAISEADCMEGLGFSPNVARATVWDQNRVSYNPTGLPQPQPDGPTTLPFDWSMDFGNWGTRVGAPGDPDAGMLSYWWNDKQVIYTNGPNKGQPWLYQIPAGTSDLLAIQVTNARGAGYPDVPSPAGYEDMFVGPIGVWTP